MPRALVPQSITVDYLVEGELDGVTPAPPVEIDQSAENPTRFDPDNQIYIVPVEGNLGIIDPDLGTGGSIGPRCLPFLWIDTEELGEADAAVDVVGIREDGDFKVQKTLVTLVGAEGAYLDEGAMVPQGSALRVVGFPPSASGITRVRVTILVPETCADFSLAVIADKTSGGGGGDLCDSNPVSVAPANVAGPGTATDGSRCDHVHALPSAAPVTVVGATNSKGTANSVSLSDHEHRMELIGQDAGVEAGRRPILNVTGSGASLVDDAGGDRLILDVPGSGNPLLTETFDDDDTIDLVVGVEADDACVVVDLALSNDDGEVTCWQITLSVSDTPGVGIARSIVPSDAPLSTVDVTGVLSAGDIIVRLVGSGPGTSTAVAYRIVETLPRLLP